MFAYQMVVTTIDLNQAAGSYNLFIGASQAVLLESLIIRLPNMDCSDDASLTGISIQTDDVTPTVIINSAQGVASNLTAEAQLGYMGEIYVSAGTKIQLTIAGGAADVSTVCDIVAKCRAVVAGGCLV